jgi:hypothetical protein
MRALMRMTLAGAMAVTLAGLLLAILNGCATPTATDSAVPTLTPTLCPAATPEPLWVEPVTSPTDQFTQVITVRLGNGEWVNVAAESGAFTVTGSFNAYSQPALVEMGLLPNTTHHVRVTGRVRVVKRNGCVYGGYTLSTIRDRFGGPLVITQVFTTASSSHFPVTRMDYPTSTLRLE